MLRLHSAEGITSTSNCVCVCIYVHALAVLLHAGTAPRKCHIAWLSPESLYPFHRKFTCKGEKTGVNKEPKCNVHASAQSTTRGAW